MKRALVESTDGLSGLSGWFRDRDAARISGDDCRASSRRRMPNGEADALGASVSGVSLREKWTDVSTSVRRSRVGEAGADSEERAKAIANRAR